jgi:hypothetical protein
LLDCKRRELPFQKELSEMNYYRKPQPTSPEERRGAVVLIVFSLLM